MSSLCMHLYVIDENFSTSLLTDKKKSLCSWCHSSGPNLWLCLYRNCLKVGCGENGLNHSNIHNNQLPSHCIVINLSNYKVWCFMCEMEITSNVLCKLTMNPSQQIHFGDQIRAPGIAVARPVTPNDSSTEDDGECSKFTCNDDLSSKGLVGLCNLGLTCYMNAALQALSNSIPLCQFMRDCSSFLSNERKQPGLVWPFHRLINEIWHQNCPSSVAPNVVYHTFRTLYPMFRPFSQQDSQEFLRYFMDQLHQELREPCLPLNGDSSLDEEDEDDGQDVSSIESVSRADESDNISSRSDAEDYETCDSGVSDRSISSKGSKSSKNSLQHRVKRKKRHHNSYCKESKVCEPDQSEFSDAMSDSSLLDWNHTSRPDIHNSNFLKTKYSVSSSGIGSSKPSVSSVTSFASKSMGSLRSQNTSHLNMESRARNPGAKTNLKSPPRKRKHIRYRSVISDCFDGVLISSVQCLTCNRTSSRKETFQDLSLPIPSSDQLNMLLQQHLTYPQIKGHGNLGNLQNSSHGFYLSKNTCDVTGDGWMWLWIWSIWGWVRSWLWGPNVSLLSCLAAFFSADELKGDNMYSCEKCGKLRNGIKYSKVIQLPEVLIIHLKRFRHDYMFSSKISQYVSFPMHGLDLSPFLHKDCSSEVRTYDLYSVICHHGAVGGGHYTAYAQNASNGKWYEFDDQCVTEVSPDTVANCESYVLFYKKVSPQMLSRRQRTVELMQVSSRELSLMQFYVSKQWINKFNTFAEPGPVDNSDFLCPHGGVQPSKAPFVDNLVMSFSQGVWEYLHQVFGGGPACTSLYECVTCREEQEALHQRQKYEHETFIKLHTQFQEVEHPEIVYAISMKWYRSWEAFVLRKQMEAPGPLDNSAICVNKNGQITLKSGSDYAPISKAMWIFFYDIYGGGPDLFVRYSNPQYHGSKDAELSDSSEETSNVDAVADALPFPAIEFPSKLKSLSSSDLSCCALLHKHPKHVTRQRSLSASEIIFSSLMDCGNKNSNSEEKKHPNISFNSEKGIKCSSNRIKKNGDKFPDNKRNPIRDTSYKRPRTRSQKSSK